MEMFTFSLKLYEANTPNDYKMDMGKLKSVYWHSSTYGKLPILFFSPFVQPTISRQFSVQDRIPIFMANLSFSATFFCLNNLQFCRLATLNLKHGSNRIFVDMLNRYFSMMRKRQNQKSTKKKNSVVWCQIRKVIFF